MAGTRCALLIGNNAYCDAEFPPLTKPARDVADFAALLRDPRIGAFDEVTEYVDRSWHEVQRDISRFFRQRHKDDLLLLYFSGHGRRESGDFYLVFNDTEFDTLDASAISAQFVRQQIERSPSQRKIIILDCCYSGAFGEKGAAVGAADALNAFEGNGYGRIILTASKATETAQELPKGLTTPYSLFTHFLLEGIRTGKADHDDDGKIAADELFDYVSDQMRAIAAPQTPQRFLSAQHGEIVVAKNPCWKSRSDRSLLPRWLLNLLNEDDSSARSRAIDELVLIIQRRDERFAVAALTELRRLSREDPAPRVRRGAEGGLEELGELESRDVPPLVEEIIELRDDEYELIEEANEPSTGDLWREPVTGMEFVYIPAGQFMMGQTETEKAQLIKEVGKEKYQEWFVDELPRHQVTISHGFWMGKYPVTNAQYRRFKAKHDSGAYEGHSLNGDDQPVVMVSWDDAQAFIEWLNTTHPFPLPGGENQDNSPPGRGKGWVFRLPSEAEWEYACRAGTETIRYWGDDPKHDLAGKYANVGDASFVAAFPKLAEQLKKDYKWMAHACDDGYAVTSPVGKFKPNAFGLYDMLGNVWEWCQDSYVSYNGTPKDGSAYGSLGDKKAKLLRGGSWVTRPDFARGAVRGWLVPDCQFDGLGFRVVVVR
ncbi:hypothetical protein U14_04831 [Candidatus Moduliflexus flocculans]|uniref:Uncharacterized protein n=1 Tax=Candidatus Moduliflexus flocculans TaxID=1499966 RepID=A0A0S6W193_9BACT|nr:hypothetical protein U14_04831 [Candidatus Moduliflexus flocculans]